MVADAETFYGGESVSGEAAQSYTCPYCGRLGFCEATLYEHVSSEHNETPYEVVCPICASLPGGEPNQVLHFDVPLERDRPSPSWEPRNPINLFWSLIIIEMMVALFSELSPCLPGGLIDCEMKSYRSRFCSASPLKRADQR